MFAAGSGDKRGNALGTAYLAVVQQGQQCQFLDEAQRGIRHRRTWRGVAFLQLETIAPRLCGNFLLAQLVALVASTEFASPVAGFKVIVLATYTLEVVAQ
ncbi:hypothetical protein D3C86_1712170 [compost metagenome]